MNEQTFQKQLLQQNIVLTDEQLQAFENYFQLLVEWNEKVNLTAITEKNAVYLKHFYDSISPSFYFNFNEVTTVCDVGAGAGFPSLPLKICFPHLHVTIIDSLKKRITFLETLVRDLGLDNVTLVHGRAEDVGQDPTYREQYDVVLARAVANLRTLSEYCLPLSKRGGTFIALKGADGEEELDHANKALQILGGQLLNKEDFNLPVENSARTIFYIKKIKNTPKKYPRKAGMPNKHPL